MKIRDVIHGQAATFELRRVGGEAFPPGLEPGAEILLRDHDGATLLAVGEQVWEVEAASGRDHDQLRSILEPNLPRLAWLAQAPKPGGERVFVEIHTFPAALLWDQPVDIGVDERIVEDVRRRQGGSLSTDAAVQWLEDSLFLPSQAPGGMPRAVLSGSPAAGRATAFRLHGRRIAVDVERGSDDRLRITRVAPAQQRLTGADSRPLYLVTGALRLCDITVAGEFRGTARTELDALVAEASSYLHLWNQYNQREHESILRRARELGWARYSAAEPLADGAWRFRLAIDETQRADLWRRLDALDGAELEAGDEVPAEIVGTATSAAAEAGSAPKQAQRAFAGEIVGRRATPPSLDLRPPREREDRVPPGQGMLFASLGGDSVRIRRRREAWERIRGCTNPMPQLGLIIERQPVPARQTRHRKPLTRAVQEVFASPNAQQRRALEVALNTPDIALIQGPPGTGKTRVIAALQARLAEADEWDDSAGLSGSTLLTSFQHDAVENAAGATRVLGLPAVKIGHRRGVDDFRDGVETWARDTAQAVRAARAGAGASASLHGVLREVRALAVAHIKSPSRDDRPAELLGRVSELAGPWLPGPLAGELAALRARLAAPAAGVSGDDRAFALQMVRALRSDAVAFADDGPMTAHKALRRLGSLERDLLAEGERAVLERAAACEPGEPADADLLAALGRVRDALLDRLQPAAPSATPRLHADVEDVLGQVIDALHERARTTAMGQDVAVDEWLIDLEHDPDGVRDAIQHYTMVLAATCQQSASHAMGELKQGDAGVFRTVIVDEAARANPLDLLIPMARAERRIVLVGDHRQLPHVLEPDIERELEQSVQEATREALQQSLFERLFVELKERERRDGISRVVTLNMQYRMHPVLGALVSDQFYAPHGEGFAAGRPAEDFAHTVALADGTSLAGRVAAWIDVPHHLGAESGGRSKKREVEARRVAREARAIVEAHPELSVGVIAFYSAQRDEILARMAEGGLTEIDDAGDYRVRAPWQRTRDGRERLRVGTVDAFQGKEFDVVILSLTRSSRNAAGDERGLRRRYGFLMLENRLCVAMSRQHRLLIVVGDSNMARGAEARAAVPALEAFHTLCEGPHGCMVRS